MTSFKEKFFKIKWKYYISFIAIAVFLIVTFIFNPTRTDLYMFEQMAISIILAVSLSFVVGFLGELSLGHAGFMCIGAYIGGKAAAILSNTIHSPFIVLVVSVIIGGLAAAAAGVIVGLPVLRLKGDYIAIVTLAFGEIVRVLFSNSKKETFGGAFGLETPRYDYKVFYIIAFVFVMITIAVFQNIIRSKHGRAITAIRDSEIAARATGINVTKYKLLAFTFSAFFAGVAGVLFSFTQSKIQSTSFDYNYSIEILVMVVLGGMGSINGSMIAAVVISFLKIKLGTILTGNLAILQNILYSLILILIVIYNNAPALSRFRDKYNIKRLILKKSEIAKDPAFIKEDEAKWDRVPTKIEMNEIISTDFEVEESVIKPDRPEPGKENES